MENPNSITTKNILMLLMTLMTAIIPISLHHINYYPKYT